MSQTTFEGIILVSSPRAVLFQSHFWEAPLWFPLSQMDIQRFEDSFECVVKVKDWLCRKKNLYEFTMYTMEEIEQMSGI